MTEDLLITLDDIRAVKQVSQNISSVDRMQPFIQEAQIFDLKNKLGPVFYQDLITNKGQQIYIDILNGLVYTNTQNHVVSFGGIKQALAYYTYARFILEAQDTVTAAGVVRKVIEGSEPVSEKTLVAKSLRSKNSADAILDDVIVYLNQKTTIYTKWIVGTCDNNKSSGATFYGVDNTSCRNENNFNNRYS